MADKDMGSVACAVSVLAVNINAITTRTIIFTNKFRCDMIFSLAERLGDGFPVL
jgi:hypothetical protein